MFRVRAIDGSTDARRVDMESEQESCLSRGLLSGLLIEFHRMLMLVEIELLGNYLR